MRPSNLACLTRVIWKILEEDGYDPESLFIDVGLDPNQLGNPDARFDFSAVDKLWEKTGNLIADPCIGLRAVKHWHPSHFGALGYAWLASSSLRTALHRVNRYAHVLSENFDLALEDTSDGYRITPAFKPFVMEIPARVDAILAVIMHMCRINSNDKLDPVLVTFTHEEYPCSGEYFAYFRSPVQFKAATDSLVLPAQAIDQRLSGGNPQLAQLTDQVMVHYLANLDRNDLSQRVKALIIDQLPSGSVSENSVAEALHMSVRSLQRKLQDRDASFRQLLEEARRELAQKYVSDPAVSLSEVAYLLGFSDSSSFSRAYKRWNGISPGEARQSIRQSNYAS